MYQYIVSQHILIVKLMYIRYPYSYTPTFCPVIVSDWQSWKAQPHARPWQPYSESSDRYHKQTTHTVSAVYTCRQIKNDQSPRIA